MIDFKGCNLQFAKAELAFRETKELTVNSLASQILSVFSEALVKTE